MNEDLKNTGWEEAGALVDAKVTERHRKAKEAREAAEYGVDAATGNSPIENAIEQLDTTSIDLTIFDGVVQEMRQHAADPLPMPDIGPSGLLPIESVKFRAAMFQPRQTRGSAWKRDKSTAPETTKHIATLMEACRTQGMKLLDPIEVWWSGKAFFVLDGHHRLAAYAQINRDAHNAGKKKPYPEVNVKVFTGTLVEAKRHSDLMNSKDKLPIPKADKMERCWQELCSEFPEMIGSSRELQRRLGVSKGTQTNMTAIRDALRKHGVKPQHHKWQEVKGDRWQVVAGLAERQTNPDWNAKDREVVDEILQVLRKNAKHIRMNPNLLGEALAEYDERTTNKALLEDPLAGMIADEFGLHGKKKGNPFHDDDEDFYEGDEEDDDLEF
jgi:hypothetical protein